MSPATRGRLAERLAELKRTNVPRASLERLGGRLELSDGATWEDAIAVVVLERAIDAHLRHFAWMLDEDGERTLCPSCLTRGFFSWGMVHGKGYCSCGWPGTLYHFVPDPDPDAPCRHCARPKSEHAPRTGTVGVLPAEGEPYTETCVTFPCPVEDDWPREYAPRHAARFTRLLWAHPYEVSAGRG